MLLDRIDDSFEPLDYECLIRRWRSPIRIEKIIEFFAIEPFETVYLTHMALSEILRSWLGFLRRRLPNARLF